MLRNKILTDDQINELEKEYNRTFDEDKIFHSLGDVEKYLKIESFYNSKSFADSDLPSINLTKCLFNFDVRLQSVIFTKKITFARSVFVGKVNFFFVQFNAPYIDYKHLTPTKLTPNNFSNVVFLDDCSFKFSKFTNGVDFRRVIFKKRVNFSNAHSGGDIDMQSCTFSEEVYFIIDKEISTNQDSPISISFDESVFSKKVLFYNRVFSSCSFSNTKFNALADFFKTNFKEDVCFNKTDFLGTTVFAEATFHKKAIFLYTQVSRNMILRRSHFLNGVNLALINFIGEGYINSFEVDINKDFTADSNVLEYSEDELSKKINIKHKRETFRILKHEALKQNNRIEALKYHASEMKAYEIELKESEKKENRKIIKTLKRVRDIFLFILRLFTFDCKKLKTSDNLSNDKLILLFNKVTNSFGTNWIRSISFTFWIAIVWYVIFLAVVDIDTPLCWDWNCNNIRETVEYAFRFLNITEWDYEPFGAKYSWAYIPLFVGRIFISLGIYQTIQAFRKYGRF